MSLRQSISSWVLATRPKTLAAAFVPVAVGTAFGAMDYGKWSWLLAALALAACLALQISTNLFNDYLDFKKGADSQKRIGPVRVSAGGLLEPQMVFIAACSVLFLALCFAIPLVAVGGWPIILIGIPSLYLCYGYTGGPYPLAYHGLGEIFVILFFGLVAVGGSYYLQTDSFSGSALLAGLQIGLLSAALIAINNLRDIDEDRLSRKKTLAVRWGRRFARFEIADFLLFPYLLGLCWIWFGHSKIAWLPWLALPLALFIIRQIYRYPPGKRYNRLLAFSALHLLLFSTALILGRLI